MNIRIDDDVPMPQPDKPDTWVTGPKAAPKTNTQKYAEAIRPKPKCGTCGMPIVYDEWTGTRCDCVEIKANDNRKFDHVWKPIEPLRYPAETTYDAKGVPTVDCFLVGGPLNGKHGPIVGTAKVVELDIYAADGSVSSVELYELCDKGELGCRVHKGTKP